MQFVKFPSIEQFRKVVKTVNDKSAFNSVFFEFKEDGE